MQFKKFQQFVAVATVEAPPTALRISLLGANAVEGPMIPKFCDLRWFCFLALIHVGYLPLALHAQHLIDPDFELMAAGDLLPTGKMDAGWEIQKTGREKIKDRLRISVIDDSNRAHAGANCIELAVPAETEGFEFVSVGQRLTLRTNTEYVASVWVRWISESSDPQSNAIVSFWMRDRDGNGHFAGRDVWLRDHEWTQLQFPFRPNDISDKLFLYVSLLPNQKPVATELLIDDFTVRAVVDSVIANADERKGNLIVNPRFQTKKSATLDAPWYFASSNGQSILGKLLESEQGNSFSMAIPDATSNFDSGNLWQHVHMVEGQRYRIQASIRWDDFSPENKPPIVNYGVYKEETNTWYGPIDQTLAQSGQFETYTFDHIATATGPWMIYTRLNGWGNFGNPVSITIGEFSCEPVPK